MRNKLLKGLAIGFCASLATIGLVACGDGGGSVCGDPPNLNGGKALNYTLLDDDTYGVSVGECYDVPEITIPANYDGKKVTTIMNNFFEVGTKVLGQDEQGADVTLQEKDIVTYSIIINEGVTTLEAGAFNVHSLKRLELAKSVVNFGDSSVAWSQAPQGLVEIYNKGNLPLTNEDTLGDYAWLGRLAEHIYTDSADRKVTMDNNGIVTYVDTEGKKALLDYCGTESVLNVPTNIDYVYESACWAIPVKEINIPANCKSVEDYAFNWCPNLEIVNISEGVEKIGDSFMYLNNFIYANVPESVTTLDSYAFNAQVYVGVVCYYGAESDYNTPSHSRNKLYDVKSVEKATDGFVYAVRSEDVVLLKYLGNASEIVIADTYANKPVTEVYDRAFIENEYITKLTVGNNVTKIGNSAFYACENLFEVILSDSVTDVKNDGFKNCENLVKLTIGANVQNMYYTAGMPAFGGCYRLTEVYNRSTYERALSDLNACNLDIDHTYAEGTSRITVENGLVLYTDGDVCKVVNYIGESTEVVIPDKVTEIKRNAFRSKEITKVTLGNGVTEIGERAFMSCSSLTDVTISASVTKISASAFSWVTITEISYLGTMTQWNSIEKEDGWCNSDLEKAVCTDGEVQI